MVKEATAPDFAAYALKHDLDDDSFPHAKQGLALYRVMMRTFWTGVVVLIIGWGIRYGGSFIPDVQAYTVEGETFDTDQWVASIREFIMGTGTFIMVLAVLIGVLLVVLIGFYMVITVMRWRSWERHCFINDIRSEHLRKQILRTLNVKKYRAEAKKAIQSSRKSEDNSSVPRNQEAKMEAYNSLRKLKVFVNTRQSLDFDKMVLRYYRIVVEKPYAEDSVAEFQNLVSKLSSAASRVSGQKFGDGVVSDDDRTISFSDRMRVKDRYARKPRKAKGQTVATSDKYQYAYSLDCLTDNSQKIAAVKQRAQRWAEQRASDLDDLLFTQDVRGRRLRTTVGASTATIVYDMSFSIDMSQFGNREETINKAFKTEGTSISVESGELLVTIMLPKDRQLPIDIRSLYTSVFGDPEPMEKKTAAVAA